VGVRQPLNYTDVTRSKGNSEEVIIWSYRLCCKNDAGKVATI
jgi:hypothetical protein